MALLDQQNQENSLAGFWGFVFPFFGTRSVVFAEQKFPHFSFEAFKYIGCEFSSPDSLGGPYVCARVLFDLTPHLS